MATADLPAPPTPSRAAAPRWHGEDNLGRAVIFIMVAALLLPMLNAGAKYLATAIPSSRSPSRATPVISST